MFEILKKKRFGLQEDTHDLWVDTVSSAYGY